MLLRFITKNLSLRISMMVVYGLSLLTATLVVMFHFVHGALKEEAMSYAGQTLDAPDTYTAEHYYGLRSGS